ncbi:serine protease 53-like [Odontomachus brunneus]|uniref:serine protease 53-like n=1 Tax=Odontomachus brunneus TaxID=486640 RepID=UPI0013F27CAF|nr:serine protease 53-like [Odontomachus brunneus]
MFITMSAFAGLIIAYLILYTNGLPSPFIIGGNNASIVLFPYQASLRYNDRHFCNGAIISKNYVITAAQCIYGNINPFMYTVAVGSSNLNTPSAVYSVMEIVVHIGYNKARHIHDIALVRIEKDIQFDEKIQPIALPDIDQDYDDYPLMVTGWAMNNVSFYPYPLQEILVKGYSQEDCNREYGFIQESQICTKCVQNGQGLCNGDVGDPVVINGVLVGLVSHVRCDYTYPDISTKIFHYKSWIDENMRNQDRDRCNTIFITMNAFAGLIIVYLILCTNGLPSPFIIDGKNAPIALFPYQVSLRYKDEHFCNGAIISKNYVITAAQCIYGNINPFMYTVAVGSNNLNKPSAVYSVIETVVHIGYNKARHIHDIALVRTEKDIQFDENIQPIALPDIDRDYDGYPLMVTGWAMNDLYFYPYKLQEILVKGYSQEDCNREYGFIQESQICTKCVQNGQGLCNGDVGDPVVINGVLVGLVSYVRCDCTYPDISTKIFHYKAWIDENMRKQ